MKTALLSLTLLTAKQDTTPYLHQPYYSEDTVYTNRELRIVNHQNAVKLKASERNGISSFLVGVLVGVVTGLGVALTVK